MRQARMRKGLSLLQASDKLDVSSPTLSRIELGFNEPSTPLAVKMGRLYGVTTATVYRWYFRTVLTVRQPQRRRGVSNV